MRLVELVWQQDDAELCLRITRAQTYFGSSSSCDVVLPQGPGLWATLVDFGGGRFFLRPFVAGTVRKGSDVVTVDGVSVVEGDRLSFGDATFVLRRRPEAAGPDFTQHHEASLCASAPAVLWMGSERFELDSDEPFNIGTDGANDLVIADGYASRYHARLTRSGGRWLIRDLDSTNGTRVNGLRVGQGELPESAVIKIGAQELRFERASVRPTRSTSAGPARCGDLIGESAAMLDLFRDIERMAGLREPVLITGPSGCGKELVARALHDLSSHAKHSFLALNCGALTPSVVEAELFGHVKGAFTGADRDRPGAFEAVGAGTLFLDEIGELPLALQPKLLRVLESKKVRRVGGTKEIEIQARVVAATHRDLPQAVEAHEFRMDLYHRLYVLSLEIPGLDARRADIVPLARSFVQSLRPDGAVRLSDGAEARLEQASWPGNVRELRNVIVRSILMSDQSVIEADALRLNTAAKAPRSVSADVRDLDTEERARIMAVLRDAKNNRAEAARMLNVSKSTFHDRLKRLGIGLKFGQRN